MNAPAFPEPKIDRLFQRNGDAIKWLSGCRGFYPSGTEALYWVYRGLGVGPGVTVWLPSYNCGVEVGAAERCGARTGFFRTRPDLTHDVDDLERRFRQQPGPVVVIHYFGQPQPETGRIAALCRAHGVPWIADCAHAMLTRRHARWLHQEAPAAIFSLHKFWGLYDGGALWVDEAHLRDFGVERFLEPDALRFYPQPYVAALKHTARRSLGPGMTRLWRSWRYQTAGGNATEASDHALHADTPQTLAQIQFGRAMSRLSRQLLRGQKIEDVVRLRRENYQRLALAIAGHPDLQPVFPALEEGVCPLVLPLFVPARRELLSHLRHDGIDPFIFGEHTWPGIDPDEYTNMQRLRLQVLGLPVQQDLNVAQMDAIGRSVMRWRASTP